MSQFDTLQSITSRLKELGDELSSSKLTQEELGEFETLSRKLYEITVILNYKAKEEVFRNNSKKKEASTEPKKEPERQNVYEKKENDAPVIKNREEAPATGSHGLVEFDFSGEPKSSEESAVSVPEINTKETEVPQNTVIEEQKVVAEEIPSQEQISEQEMTMSQGDVTFFYNHFTVTYNEALKDKLNNSKIDSIKNAIGLNEKLQFIGELFGGNSDLFNQTVEELDQLEDNEVALKKLSQIAAQKRWDKEAELVDQFANLVNRRYVK